MKECDYKHCLLGVVLLAAMLFMAPSYGVLLAVSSVVVLVFALSVGLLTGVFSLCERRAEESVETTKNWGTVQIKTSVPSRH